MYTNVPQNHTLWTSTRVIKIIMAFQADTLKEYYEGYHLKEPSIWRWQISSRVYLQEHNVTILGPGLLHPVTRILALTGAGLLAEGVKLHTTIFNEDNVKLPYAPSGVTSNKQQLKRRPKLMPPETNAPCLKCQNLLPIPPVVWNSILQATSSKAPSLILVISAAMQEFIKNSTTIKACETI